MREVPGCSQVGSKLRQKMRMESSNTLGRATTSRKECAGLDRGRRSVLQILQVQGIAVP